MQTVCWVILKRGLVKGGEIKDSAVNLILNSVLVLDMDLSRSG